MDANDYIFQRGDKVHFKGNKDFTALENTYVWACNPHIGWYVVQYPGGFPKENFLASMGCDGFESIHSSLLHDDFHYIYAEPEELFLVEKNQNGNK
jgi:hypothetical protein